jgi:hypothetical protein
MKNTAIFLALIYLLIYRTEIHATLHHLYILLSCTQSALTSEHALKLDRMLVGKRLSVKVQKCVPPATDMCNAVLNLEE